ncbi:hypothetical protein A5752_15610 [Mycobacterium sp. 852002-51961_SCH5331710]|nr:hypothetical protein A5752_15610 [Mycobacterium sp. 852002-51961_SCH5331710]
MWVGIVGTRDSSSEQRDADSGKSGNDASEMLVDVVSEHDRRSPLAYGKQVDRDHYGFNRFVAMPFQQMG